MSRARKQGISGLLSVFNLALGLFRKKCNVLLRILMSLDRKEKAIKYTRCKFLWQKNSFSCNNYFHFIALSSLFRRHFAKKIVIFSFLFLFIFPLFAVSSNKQILLRIYLEYLGKKKNSNNKQTNKTKRKQPIRFISPALPRGLPYCYLFIL